ncbi:hypothetical protein TUMEXPCC7403_24010 [Tumidithrix helvetica PCC 7403]|uniref:hypothetical protein n=1 Tax=Tumidithrix helvetica TaxID=3457545 RepID=UPI003CAAA664
MSLKESEQIEKVLDILSLCKRADGRALVHLGETADRRQFYVLEIADGDPILKAKKHLQELKNELLRQDF